MSRRLGMVFVLAILVAGCESASDAASDSEQQGPAATTPETAESPVTNPWGNARDQPGDGLDADETVLDKPVASDANSDVDPVGSVDPDALERIGSTRLGEELPVSAPDFTRGIALLTPNVGQYDEDVSFLLRHDNVSFAFGEEGFDFASRTSAASLRAGLRFVGGTPVTPEVGEALPGHVNYLVGPESRWRTRVPTYDLLTYEDVWPGIDVIYEPRREGLEYSIRIAAGADLSQLRFQYTQAGTPVLAEDGTISVRIDGRPLRETAPVALVAATGRRIPCAFELHPDGTFGFSANLDGIPGEVIIDPTIMYTSFIGAGSGNKPGRSVVEDMVVDDVGRVYITGITRGDFPSTPGAYDRSHSGATDVFVTLLSADGTDLLWSTFLGGSGEDEAPSLAVDAVGNVALVGKTNSPDFPTTAGTIATTVQGGWDTFVAQLNADGSSLAWATLLGGSEDDSPAAVQVDAAGAVYVTGNTESADFPTTAGAFDTTLDLYGDVYVAKITVQGQQLDYSTFIGGTQEDTVVDLALADSGDVVVVGTARVVSGTPPLNFPTTAGSYATVAADSLDAFVVKLSADGASVIWASFLGGIGAERVAGVELDAQERVTVAGTTFAADFPTTAFAADSVLDGTSDIFVAQFAADGTALVSSTLIGGSLDEECTDLALSSTGQAILVGTTDSADFPITPGAYDTGCCSADSTFVLSLAADGSVVNWATRMRGAGTPIGSISGSDTVYVAGAATAETPTTSGAYDSMYRIHSLYVAHLDAVGGVLLWSTLLDEEADDIISAIDIDTAGDLYLTGTTTSRMFPVTAGAFDASHGGESDVFVARFSSQGAQLEWSTFVGGGGRDLSTGIVVDSAGNVVVSGSTRSSDFPRSTGGIYQAGPDTEDLVLASFSSAGALNWTARFGGSGRDVATAVDVSVDGSVFVCGHTTSADFPVSAGALQSIHGGETDAVLARVGFDGGLAWSTFLGGLNNESCDALVVGPQNGVYIGGIALGTFFSAPPPSPDREKFTMAELALAGGFPFIGHSFAARYKEDGSGSDWSTVLPSVGGFGAITALTMSATGELYAAGMTGTGFVGISPFAPQPVLAGGFFDGFVIKLDPLGAGVLWGTYVGSIGFDYIADIDVDSVGDVVIGGRGILRYDATSFALPLPPGATDSGEKGELINYLLQDLLATQIARTSAVTKIHKFGTEFTWSTPIGDVTHTNVHAVRASPADSLYVAGDTDGTAFNPISRSYQPVAGGSRDGFLLVLGDPAVGTPELATPFRFARVNTATPTLYFVASHGVGAAMGFQVEWALSSGFWTGQIEHSPDGEGFANYSDPTDTGPLFRSGDIVTYTIPASVLLQDGLTYWWRTRAYDSGGYHGEYSSVSSMTIDSLGADVDWHQTTFDQFGLATHVNTNSSGSIDGVAASPYSTTLESATASPLSYNPVTTFNAAGNAFADDGVYAATDSNSPGEAVYEGFGFSDLGVVQPVGIEVSIDAFKVGGRVVSAAIALSGDGGATYSTVYTQPVSAVADGGAALVFGGLTDLWGQAWALSGLSDANFRIRVSFNIESGGSPTVAYLDDVSVVAAFLDRRARTVTSPIIVLADYPAGASWTAASWTQGAEGGEVTVEVLDALDAPTGLRGTTTAASPLGAMDITSLGLPSLKLRASFSDLGAGVMPSLLDWTVDAGNSRPIALAGPDQNLTETDTVILDGSASSDLDGDALTYLWTQVSGAAVTLLNPTSAGLSFPAPSVPVDTALVFELVVNDSFENSVPDLVTVNIANTVNDKPTAVPGPDAVWNEDAAITLDGSGSFDVNGDALTYAWTQLSGPSATLTSSADAAPTVIFLSSIVADTSVAFSLTVRDGLVDSDSATVNLTVLNNVNEAPVASVGADQSLGEQTVAALDGTSSVDPNGNLLSYSWSQTAGPNVVLQNAFSATPTFTTPTVFVPTDFVFALVVNDGITASAPTNHTVTVNNTINEAPTAAPGANQTVNEGAVVVLTAAASNDVNGDSLVYRWSQISGPSVTLNDTGAQSPSFFAPTVTSGEQLIFELVVNDGLVDSVAQEVSVTVNNSVNEAPIADAGSSRTVTQGATVVLDGSGSYDPNAETLSFAWAQGSGTSVTLNGANTNAPSFVAPTVATTETLVFELLVTDSLGLVSTTATVGITVNGAGNSIPVAVAGDAQTTAEDVSVMLSSTGSSDADGDPLTYAWSQTMGPAVTLQGPTEASPTFTAPRISVATTLTFALTVNDGKVDSAPAQVNITVENSINELPIADPGLAQTVSEQTMVTLNSGGSADSNGDVLTFLWAQTMGIAVTFDDATSATPQFLAPSVTNSEVLTFELTVHDGTDSSIPVSVTISIANTVNEVPAAHAGPDQSVGEGVLVTLDGGLSDDPNVDPLTYRWSQQSGPLVTLSDITSFNPTFTSPTVTAPSSLVFVLTVNDGGADSGPDEIQVLVINDKNEKPDAAAGADQSVGEGILVTLDGFASADPNGDVLTYDWVQIEGPTVLLDTAGEMITSFVTPSVNVATELVFELTVHDSAAYSVPDPVTIAVANTVNERPIADAGAALIVDEFGAVQLDAGASSDPDGDLLSFAWSQLSGIEVTFDDSTSPNATITAPSVFTESEVVLQLVVSDGGLESLPVNIVVTIRNAVNDAPVANAGDGFALDEEGSGLIDASESYDPNGDPLTYSWTQIAGPSVNLSLTGIGRWGIAAPRVVADVDLVFEIVAHDGELSSPPYSVSVHVANSINEPPVALAGDGQMVNEDVEIALDGSGSSDANGNALSYKWQQTAGPLAVLDDSTSPNVVLTVSNIVVDSELVFELIVGDGMDFSAPSEVTVLVMNSVNEPPAADAGTDMLVSPGATITLDGSGSMDANGEALTYLWSQVAGAPVVLTGANEMLATFLAPTPDAPTIFEFELTVTDIHGDSSVTRISIEVAAAIGPPVILSRPRLVSFVGEDYAYDADGAVGLAGETPITVTLVTGPEDMVVDGQTGGVEWTPTSPGLFDVEIAAGNVGGTVSQTFSVRVFGRPKINTVGHPHFLVGASYTYDGATVSGPGAVGSLPIAWTIERGPAEMVIDRDTGLVRWISVSAEPQEVVLRASNAFGFDEQSFTVARDQDGTPYIERTGNAHGAFGVAYVYDADSKISLANVLDGEVMVVNVVTAPFGFNVHPVSHRVTWRPDAARDFDISLALETASGEHLGSYQYSVTVVELPADGGPEAIAQASPQAGVAPLEVALDGAASTGTDGSEILSYRWDTGDDHVIVTTEPITSHTYTSPGRYLPVLTVTDVLGIRNSDKVEVAVQGAENMPPIARIRADNLVGQDELTVRFHCDCSDPDGELRSLEWNFGDGEISSVGSPVHTYVHPGTYRVRVTVRDSAGLPASDATEVVISAGDRVAPAIQIQATPSLGDSPLRVELAVSSQGLGGEPRYTWRFNDIEDQVGEKVVRTYIDPGYFSVAVDMEVEDADGFTLRAHDARTIYVSRDGIQPPRIVSSPATFATVGKPYAYDVDLRPTAQGDRPMVWRIGRVVDGMTIGAPEGMTVDLDSGEISWVPAGAQVGDHTVVLLAENTVAVDVQQFVVHVIAGAEDVVAADGCGCGAQGKVTAGPAVLLLGIMTLGLGRRRRS